MPIVKILLAEDCRVTLVAENRAAAFLQKEFPQLSVIPCVSLNIHYPEKGALNVALARQAVKKKKWVEKEHNLFSRLDSEYHFDAVISDNRFGCYLPTKPSVILTHQLHIKAPLLLSPWINRTNKKWLNKFHQVWVVDYENLPGLAGELSHPSEKWSNVRYVGLLSRLQKTTETMPVEYEWLGLISGPENQRTVFEKLLFRQLSCVENPCVLVRGVTEGEIDVPEEKGNVRVYHHVSTGLLEKLFEQSRKVVCRSGYSTLMDLEAVQKKALLIPTPGQMEQEYLATKNAEANRHFCASQRDFKLESFASTSFDVQFRAAVQKNSLEMMVKEWVESIALSMPHQL